MHRLPSTDLYFRNAMAPHLARWWRRGPIRQTPIRQIGANCFTCGTWLVLIRQDSPAVMRTALTWPGPLAYVVDDDIAGAATSPGLPAPYRARLAAFDREFHRALLAKATALLVPSDALAARFAKAPAITATIHRIEPAWHLPLADQSHFAALGPGSGSGAHLRIAHLGTASHGGALAALAPALADLLARHPHLHFTYVAPAPLPGLPPAQTTRVAPRRWPHYRRWLAGQRFHLALYPLANHAFDRARSASKLHEHAITGAAAIYPQGWPPAQALGPGALYAPADPAAWGEALESAIATPENLAKIAGRAAATLGCQDAIAVQQSLWAKLLGMRIT